MERLFGTLELRSTDDELREFEGVANTSALDDHGTVVEPNGARFTLPIPLLWQHDQKTPVGQITSAELRGGKWWVKGSIVKVTEPGKVKDATDQAWHNVKYGLVRGLSIGFNALKEKGNRFVEWAWRELSLVTIPSNAEANIVAVRSAYLAASGEAPSPGVSGTSTTKPRPKKMTIQERITQFQNTRAAKVAARDAVLESVADQGETLDAAQQEQYDTLNEEIRSIDQTLSRLEISKQETEARAVAVDGTSSENASKSRGGVASVKVRAHAEPGIAMARTVRAIALAHRQHRDVESVARTLYPDDTLVRAAVTAHTTGNSDALVSDEGGVYADFVEFLRPQTIIGKFGTNGVPSLRSVPFRTPLITQTTGGAGYWVGEGAAKPLTKFAWTRTTIEPLKVANIAVVTDELLKASSPAADKMIRDSLVDALRERMDTDFIDPAKAASAGVSPASITNGVTALIASGTDYAAVKADIAAVFGAFIDANNPPTSGVWIMPATTALSLSLMENGAGEPAFPNLTMNGGTFLGLPVILSQYVPTSYDPDAGGADAAGAVVVLANASDIYVADEGGFAVDASNQASLQMDDSPTNNSATPTATTLVSMFQTNSVALRAERTINWARRRDSGVAVLASVNWA